jgi:hypothetical protein
MPSDVSNSDDIIDSRDVIARIEGLEYERSDLADELDIAQDEYDNAKVSADRDGVDFADREDLQQQIGDARKALEQWDTDNAAELKALKDLQDQAEGYSDWRHGAALIRDSHFKDYARDLAEDTGAINSDVSWPYTCIDWEQAADELQTDYTSVEFDGVTYWIR